MVCRRSGSGRSISPGSRIGEAISSILTARPSTSASGSSTPMPSAASARLRPSSSGMRTSLRSRGSVPRRSVHSRLRSPSMLEEALSNPRPLAADGTPSLRAVQEWFAAQILSAHPTSSLACEWLLATPATGDVAERLDVHRGGYPARIEAAVADTYPAVAHLIGAGALHGLVRRYVRVLSRHGYNLNDVGAELPSFLEHDALSEGLPFLPDLAALEQRIVR